jgi:preprotein translocase subunit SecA
VLNAKHHSAEAEIVAKAGQKNAVTISTNMAGRGTDIVLGEGVIELGGLYILGTERHESRRIDNQLRGRSGRQGDPGESRYFLSLQDNLLRIFGGDRITKVMDRLGMEEGEPIEHSFISRAIENAQKKVEGHNFDIRKHLLEYDDVMNQQREVVYQLRQDALDTEHIQDFIDNMIKDKCYEIADEFAFAKKPVSEWDIDGIKQQMLTQFNYEFKNSDLNEAVKDQDSFAEALNEIVFQIYNNKKQLAGSEHFGQFEKFIVLQTVDNMWKDHLLSMDHLKEGIGLRGYAQQNPLIVYKKEAFEMFEGMIERIKEEVVAIIFRVAIVEKEAIEEMKHKETEDLSFNHGGSEDTINKPVKRVNDKIGRNDLCPCGSGKKYKKCCIINE